jgi:hypothetical protein
MQILRNMLAVGGGVWSRLIWLGLLLVGPASAQPPALDREARIEVRALGSSQPARRQLAKARLIGLGVSAEAALRRGLQSEQLEVRIASGQLLDIMASRLLEQRLTLFRGGTATDEFRDLPAWRLLREAIGDEPDSRRLYERLLRAHPQTLVWLERVTQSPGANRAIDERAQLAAIDELLPLGAAHTTQADPTRWALTLLVTGQSEFADTPVLASRVRGGLLAREVRRRLLESRDHQPLRRLVAYWLRSSSQNYVNATLLKLAVYYRCDAMALELARACLAQPHAAPASVATAMVVLAKFAPEVAARELPGWVEDRRICHVWQMVAVRRRAVQTQVGDVAVALLLHLADEDPRDFGFVDIEADPALIYREFSMGFESEAERSTAHRAAGVALGLP